MTIKQLVKILDAYDPDTEVMVDGYEGGLVSNIAVLPATVGLDVNPSIYYGPHDYAENFFEGIEYNTTKAVILSRRNDTPRTPRPLQ